MLLGPLMTRSMTAPGANQLGQGGQLWPVQGHKFAPGFKLNMFMTFHYTKLRYQYVLIIHFLVIETVYIHLVRIVGAMSAVIFGSASTSAWGLRHEPLTWWISGHGLMPRAGCRYPEPLHATSIWRSQTFTIAPEVRKLQAGCGKNKSKMKKSWL